jgi:glycosyltransferase involved in cell wall biosynthesis
MKILAVIPGYNEAKAIGPLVRAVIAQGHDVLVIDDGSEDQTADLARAEGARVLSTGKKSGKGNALRLGFDQAVKNAYDAVIALDGDGQHAPSDIPLFVACAERTGARVVNGNRMQNPQGMPMVRRLTNAFMSWLISLICRQHIPDTQCGFRLISVDVLSKVRLECSDFEIETELLIKAARQGFKIASVPIETIYRNEVSKIKPVRDTLRFVRYIIRAIIQK